MNIIYANRILGFTLLFMDKHLTLWVNPNFICFASRAAVKIAAQSHRWGDVRKGLQANKKIMQIA